MTILFFNRTRMVWVITYKYNLIIWYRIVLFLISVLALYSPVTDRIIVYFIIIIFIILFLEQFSIDICQYHDIIDCMLTRVF
jgi:hypothetical protein